MKVGILTLPLHTNYGGILQAYALQTILERLGHDVIIFNKSITYKFPGVVEITKRIIKKILGRDVVIFSEKRDFVEAPIINKDIIDFRNKYLHEVFVECIEEISNYHVDTIIVGSDQIWRKVYFSNMWRSDIRNAFLYFLGSDNVKKISYAASFGIDIWEIAPKDTLSVAKCLNNYAAVSVREDSGVNLLKQYCNVDAVKVLDPTMLLRPDDYNLLIGHDKNAHNELLVYILNKDSDKEALIAKIAKEKGLKPNYVNRSMIKKSAPINERILPSVEEWLTGFRNADFVITDSFHACVFSILFNKPFVAIGNRSRGLSRFNSLLDMFELQHNLLLEASDYDSKADYHISEVAKKRLDEMRKFSMHYLSNSLNSEKCT